MEHTTTGTPGRPAEPRYDLFIPDGASSNHPRGKGSSHPLTRETRPGTGPGTGPGPGTRRPGEKEAHAVGTAREHNTRYRRLVADGITRLTVTFDLPTRTGHDSDAPDASGEVGRAGVAIDSIDDMRVLFAGIPLEAVSPSLRAEACAAPLLLLYQLVAEEQGVAAGRLSGTIQYGIPGPYVPHGSGVFPPGPARRLAADLVRYCRTELPRWTTARAARPAAPGGDEPGTPGRPPRADPAAAAGQRERIAKLRAWREQMDVDTALTALRNAAAGEDTVLPSMKDALRARATLGEVCDALRTMWGARTPTAHGFR